MWERPRSKAPAVVRPAVVSWHGLHDEIGLRSRLRVAPGGAHPLDALERVAGQEPGVHVAAGALDQALARERSLLGIRVGDDDVDARDGEGLRDAAAHPAGAHHGGPAGPFRRLWHGGSIPMPRRVNPPAGGWPTGAAHSAVGAQPTASAWPPKLSDLPIATGSTVTPDPKRAARGFNVNAVMRRNDKLAGTPLVDNAGGATIFLDTRVRIERLSGANADAPEDSRLNVDA